MTKNCVFLTKRSPLLENQTFNLQNIRRYLDFPLKIQTIGFRPKNNWVHQNNRLISFFLSFVLHQEEKEMKTLVNGVVRTSMAERVPRMGLSRPGQTIKTLVPSRLDELFFTYPAESRAAIELFGFHGCSFSLTPRFSDTLERVKSCFSELQRPGVADRLDVLAVELAQEAMISALEQQPEKMQMPDERIFLISNYFQLHFTDRIRLEVLLKKYGMTSRTFYREWKKYYTVSPAQFLIRLRLEHACRLLRNPAVRIYEIASECGFCDPMYFNRCFARHHNLPPREYRERFCNCRVPLLKRTPYKEKSSPF